MNIFRGYFGPTGLDYSIGRTNMGGCDFSPRAYTYLDTPNDTAMDTFALQVEDTDFKVSASRKIKILMLGTSAGNSKMETHNNCRVVHQVRLLVWLI